MRDRDRCRAWRSLRRGVQPAGQPLRLKPCERRVPGNVDVAGEKRLHLAFVGRIQDVIKPQAALFEVLLEAVPDGNDLRIVSHGPKQERSSAHDAPFRIRPSRTWLYP